MISVDPLTMLNNRKQLAYRFESWMHTHDTQDLYLMLVDANRFKHINDTYGHLEGDTALIRIADALRLGCRDYAGKSSISRYGGDEFVVLAWADRKKGEQEIRHLMESIHGHLKRLNSDANSPYDLTVCIGMAKVTEQSVLKDVIEEADAQLYDQKRR